MLAEDLLAEMFITIAPRIFGGKAAPTMTGLAGDFFPETRHFRLKDFFVENDEAYCHYLRR
jgi:5-amino-6-(5-phosphoribosylamino)uracil reductase